MLANDTRVVAAHRLRGLDKLLLLERERLPPGNAGHAQPVYQAQSHEDEKDAAHGLIELKNPARDGVVGIGRGKGLEIDLHQNDKNDQGEAVEKVDKAHHDVVSARATVAGNHTINDADDEANRRGHESDGQRNARPVQGAAQIVAAQVIRAQNVETSRIRPRKGRRIGVGEIDLGVMIRCKQGLRLRAG